MVVQEAGKEVVILEVALLLQVLQEQKAKRKNLASAFLTWTNKSDAYATCEIKEKPAEQSSCAVSS